MFKRETDDDEIMGEYEEDIVEEVYEKEEWLSGIAENIQVAHKEPGGPIISQCKVSLARRPGNSLIARGSVSCFLYEKNVEVLLLLERFVDGSWDVVSSSFVTKQFCRKVKTYIEFKALPGKFYRARVVCFVNEMFLGMPQRELLWTDGMWNDWNRTDGCNEEECVPLEVMYDGVPVPQKEDQKTFEKNRKPFYYMRRKYD